MAKLVVGLLAADRNALPGTAASRVDDFAMSVSQAKAAIGSAASGSATRMLIAPEYFWSDFGQIGQVPKHLGPIPASRDEKHSLYKDLKRISSSASALIIVAGSIFYTKTDGRRTVAYNICPVLRNRRFLLKAYKDFDDGNAGYNASNLTHLQKVSVPYFKADGIGFGLEVCGDHNDAGSDAAGGRLGGKLKQWNAAAGKTIDVQILVSDGNVPQRGSIVATKFFIQCDIAGTPAATRVYPAGPVYDATTAIPHSSASGAQIAGATIKVWVLDV